MDRKEIKKKTEGIANADKKEVELFGEGLLSTGLLCLVY